jgi:hypothetical protein
MAPSSLFSNGGSISQDLGVTRLANSTYTLSVFVGDRLDNLDTTYSLALMAGSSALCTFSGSNAAIEGGSFADESCTYQFGCHCAFRRLVHCAYQCWCADRVRQYFR